MCAVSLERGNIKFALKAKRRLLLIAKLYNCALLSHQKFPASCYWKVSAHRHQFVRVPGKSPQLSLFITWQIK